MGSKRFLGPNLEFDNCDGYDYAIVVTGLMRYCSIVGQECKGKPSYTLQIFTLPLM